jgi:hypothetical protein
MMVFIWLCTMASAMAPGGEAIARHYIGTMENQYRALSETRSAIADEIADLRNSKQAA